MAARRPALVRVEHRRPVEGRWLARRGERARRTRAALRLACRRIRSRPPEEGAGARMRVALVNPPWTFEGSIYFGCRAPHLPLEYGYARALLEQEGHDVLLLDAHLHELSLQEAVARIEAFAPDRLVVTTAPSYLFWRCAPPELRVPRELLAALSHLDTIRIVV